MRPKHFFIDLFRRQPNLRIRPRDGRSSSAIFQPFKPTEELEPRTLLSAAPAPYGPALKVSADAANQTVVAIDAAGDFVVVWNSLDGRGDDSILARRYNAAGVAKAPEFAVTTSTGGSQFSSLAVAMDSRGDFVVAWQTSYLNSVGWISAASFNSAGTPQGGIQRVSPQNSAQSCAVAMDATGDFVVSWFVGNRFGFGNPVGIYAQRYNFSAIAQGTSFLVNTTSLFGSGAVESHPSVAMDRQGDFVITWESNQTSLGVSARRFNFVGTPLGNEFTVYSSTLNVTEDFDPVVAMDQVGDFVITWHHRVSNTSSNQVISTQRFNSAGSFVGKILQIDSGVVGSPQVVSDAAGDFFVTWAKSIGSVVESLGQSFTAAGSPFGVQLVLPSGIVAMNASGAIVNSWIGFPTGVFVQRYLPGRPLFNHAPVGASKTLTTLEDVPYVFKTTDFGFSDPNDIPSNPLMAVKVATLPAHGFLTDNGIAVIVGTLIPVVDLNAGKLKFTPVKNAKGTAYASFTFQVQDSGGTTGGGANIDATPRTMTINVTGVNDPPVGTSKTVATKVNVAYLFKITDFGFSDPNDIAANVFAAVKITTLPVLGQLVDNAKVVTAGARIPVADIVAGKLKYVPKANSQGVALASFTFQVQDNGGTANGGVDTDLTPRKMTINVTP